MPKQIGEMMKSLNIEVRVYRGSKCVVSSGRRQSFMAAYRAVGRAMAALGIAQAVTVDDEHPRYGLDAYDNLGERMRHIAQALEARQHAARDMGDKDAFKRYWRMHRKVNRMIKEMDGE